MNVGRRQRERIPKYLRETFFSLFSKPEPETIYPELYMKIIDRGTDLILDHLRQYNERRKNALKEVKKSLTVKKAVGNRKPEEYLVVSSDAGNNGVDLRSAYLPLYAAVSIVSRGFEILEEPLHVACKGEIWTDEFKPRERESLLAEMAKFDVALKGLRKWDPDLVIVDGSLLINLRLFPGASASTEYMRDFEKTVEKAVELLNACYERGIPLIGFVKRTKMNKISKRFGFKELRDTALLDLLLKKGEYVEPEEMYRENEKGFFHVKKYFDKWVEKGFSPEALEEISIYYTYVKTGLTTPYRLEIPKYCAEKTGEITSLINSVSEENGIPFFISEVDNLTRITVTVSNLRTLMLYSKALDLVEKGIFKPEDLNLLAMQHGEAWVLREESYWRDVEAEAGK